MSVEHRSFLAERFNRPDVPLVTEACGLPEEPLPDVNGWCPRLPNEYRCGRSPCPNDHRPDYRSNSAPRRVSPAIDQL